MRVAEADVVAVGDGRLHTDADAFVEIADSLAQYKQ